MTLMLLHTGIDGGLHDVLFTNVVGMIVWGSLSINAAVYYARRWWAWYRLPKAPHTSKRQES